MAQLEFQTGMLEQAYRDFTEAIEMAGKIPSAEANAIYSAAVISRQLRDTESALEHYRQFYQSFLAPQARPFRIPLNSRYILAPIETGHIYLELDKRKEADRWYGAAEELYSAIIESGSYPGLVPEAKLNTVTAMLQQEDWNRARNYLRELKKETAGEEQVPALMYLEGRIELNGFENRDRAVALMREIAERFPESKEASSALVAAAGIRFREGKFDEAAALCRKVVSDYGRRDNEVAEAVWMLAEINEKSGDWAAASLHYKSLYTNYPYTLQGLEAPLRIASHFAEGGETEVAADAYARAREHYRELIGESNSQGARLMVEKYLVRSLTEEGRWEEAVNRLLELTEEYPGYRNFRGNYLRAASIAEEKLNDRTRAAEILEECISRYPGTALAGEAEKQLDRIRRRK
jgi:TolA-binding protein